MTHTGVRQNLDTPRGGEGTLDMKRKSFARAPRTPARAALICAPLGQRACQGRLDDPRGKKPGPEKRPCVLVGGTARQAVPVKRGALLY